MQVMAMHLVPTLFLAGLREQDLMAPADTAFLRTQLARCWAAIGEARDPVQLDNLLFMIRELQRQIDEADSSDDDTAERSVSPTG
jgi:hypothetical protein